MNEDKFPAFAYFVKNYIPMEKKCFELMTTNLPKIPHKLLTKHKFRSAMKMDRKFNSKTERTGHYSDSLRKN